jgi:Major Facilitator Superfamily
MAENPANPGKRPTGMAAFTLIWFGQVISLMGSAMSGFAITIWAWQIYNSATVLAIVGVCTWLPGLIVSPISGALVDRWDRKLVMMLSDLVSGLTTVAILVIYQFGNLQIWQLCVAGAISGMFQSFQWPAYSAAITIMIPKKHFARASGMMSMAEWGSGIFAPVLAGALMAPIGLPGILVIDIFTFIFAVSTLLFIYIPPTPISSEGSLVTTSIWQEALFGFKYIYQKTSLLLLQLVFAAGNLMASWAAILIAPLVLSKTNNNASMFGLVESAGALGGIAGSSLITAWGGPKKKIVGVLVGWALCGFLGYFIIGIGKALPFWLLGSFFGSFFGPVINASNQAIWQSKVPPDIQGKVFSVRRMIAQITGPVGVLLAGPLADQVFEPAMQSNTALSRVFGVYFGSSEGSGIALMIALAGLVMGLVGISGFFIDKVFRVETLLPDFDQGIKKDPAAEALAAGS